MTSDELDEAVSSLRLVGGVYHYLADLVEHDNRSSVTETPTGKEQA